MTTYELPPEPPVGSRVRGVVQDANEPITVWTHDPQIGAWITPGRPGWMRWGQLLDAYCPQGVTLIEPDPWPTAPLIVATFLDKRCVFGRTADGNYDSPTGGLEADSDFHRDTLTNVVPVTIVPTAEWEAWMKAGEVRNLGPDRRATFERATISLRVATDALGVDL